MTAVLAGCGDLGTEVGLRLAATGRRVVGLRRTPEHLPDAILGQAVDLSRERPDIPADTELIVIATTADESDADGYRRAYLAAVDHVLDGVEAAGARPSRILFVSSTAVHDESDGGWVDEETPISPPTATAQVVRDAELRLLERSAVGTVVRLGGLYGPGRGRLIEQVRSGHATVPSTPQYTNRIHRDDAAEVLIHLGTRVADPDDVYLGVDDEPVQRREVMEFLAAELEVPGPVVDESATSRRGAGKRCRNDRLRATGFSFTYPTFREGYRAVLAGHGTRHR